MRMNRKIVDQNGREIIVSHRDTTRGSGSTPSKIRFMVSLASGISIMMEVKIPNGFDLYIRAKDKTIQVEANWSSNTLVAEVLSAIYTTRIGGAESLVFVEQSRYTAYQSMVVI